jgi:hypothetical protein
MKIRILQSTVAARKCVRPGDIVEVSEAEAQLMIGYNKAELVIEDGEAPEAPPVDENEGEVEKHEEEKHKPKHKPKHKGKKHE